MANGLLYVAASDDSVRIVELGPEYAPEPGGTLLGLVALGAVARLARAVSGRRASFTPEGMTAR